MSVGVVRRATTHTLAMMTVATVAAACTSAQSSNERGHEPTSTETATAAPSFKVIGVYRQTPPNMPPGFKQTGVATLPGNQLAFRHFTAPECQPGPLKMPIATPSRIAFKMTNGCTDGQREETFVVALRGVEIDRAREFILELRFPEPIGVRILKLPPA